MKKYFLSGSADESIGVTTLSAEYSEDGTTLLGGLGDPKDYYLCREVSKEEFDEIVYKTKEQRLSFNLGFGYLSPEGKRKAMAEFNASRGMVLARLAKKRKPEILAVCQALNIDLASSGVFVVLCALLPQVPKDVMQLVITELASPPFNEVRE